MKKKAAIVIPVWKEELTKIEIISLQQACLIFKNYTFCVITFKHLNLDSYLAILNENRIFFKIVFFNKNSFSSIEKYSGLMLSIAFYGRFIGYAYILIYQLDCFAFRDELDYWTRAGYSYIGAPWMEGYDSASYGNAMIGVGNGGFSLRKVSDHLRVLLSFSWIDTNNLLVVDRNFFKRILLNNTFFILNNFQLNEDIFWGVVSKRNFPWFKIPEWKIAAQFSVEVQPRYFFEVNNHVVPFGCHAWWRYDLEFWKPHIEKFGYKL